LAALKEFSELGAGFKIAALDLELRGAGNLLGGEQHGHINAVGYDVYVKLMEETVRELKGEEVPVEVQSTLNLGLDVRIPPEYIAEEHQRLRVYKKIADAAGQSQADAILSELRDRFGPPPEAVSNLLEFSLLKSLAKRLGIESIERHHGTLNVKFHRESRVDPTRLMNLMSRTAGGQFTPTGILRVPLEGDFTARKLLERVKGCLVHLSP
jgi:transcription-repair coupling factor (superfamily II helicase)